MSEPTEFSCRPQEPKSEGHAAGLDVRLVPAAVAAWIVTAAGIVWPIGAGVASACIPLGAVAALVWRRSDSGGSCLRRVLAANAAVAAVVGSGFAISVGLRSAAVAHHPITALSGRVVPVTVIPSESPLPAGGSRVLFRANLQRIGDAGVGADEQISGRVVAFASGGRFGEIVVGQPLRFSARVGAPGRRDLTVAALTATGPPTRGETNWVHRAAHRVRSRFAAASERALPPALARMLPALILGDTTAVPAAVDKEFRASGLTHLMAVSGANVTIVCGAVLFTARLVGPRGAVALAALALVGFVVVVQPTASVLRAAVMGAIALFGIVSRRRRQAVPSLAASVLILLAVAPQLAVDVGFALSVVATAALIVVAPVWSARLIARGWPKPLAEAVCVAWAAHLVTAPLIAGISGRLSLVSAAANLLVTAVVAPLTVLGSAAAALSGFGTPWAALADLLIRLTGPELWWVCSVAHWTASVPAATVPVAAGGGGVLLLSGAALALMMCWRSTWCRRAAAAGAAVLLAWSISEVLTAPVGVGWP